MSKIFESVEKRGRKHGRVKRIHVNQHVIRKNKKTGAHEPPLGVECGDEKVYGHDVEIYGPSRLIYRPDKPLHCGARLWLETTAPVTVFLNEE